MPSLINLQFNNTQLNQSFNLIYYLTILNNSSLNY